jgi:hypothetical protein
MYLTKQYPILVWYLLGFNGYHALALGSGVEISFCLYIQPTLTK